MTKLSFVRSLSLVQQKCQLPTPHKFGQGSHRCWRKSKFPALPLWKMTKLGFVRSLSLVQQKCQLLTPHKFGSRVPSLLTEIEISRLAILKNDKIEFCAFPVTCTAKVSITDPPQVWVKGSIIVDGNRNFPLGAYKKWQNWVLCVPCCSHSKSVNYRPPISLGQGFHRCWRKSKFPARPLWKMTKLSFVRSPLLVQQKCQLLTPHKFGSRVPSLLTEIEISRSAIMKNDKIEFCAFPVARTAKVSITDPPQVWVKGSIVVNRNRNFPLGHFEKWQNLVLCVPCRSYSKSVNYRPPISLGQGFHRCWRKLKFPARPLWKMTKLGFVRSLLLVQQKCQLPTPHKFGQGFHRCWWKSKFPARPLWKMTKLGFVRSPSLVQQKCQLLTPHMFGSRVPSLLTEIEISRSAILKNDKIEFCAFPVARQWKRCREKQWYYTINKNHHLIMKYWLCSFLKLFKFFHSQMALLWVLRPYFPCWEGSCLHWLLFSGAEGILTF